MVKPLTSAERTASYSPFGGKKYPEPHQDGQPWTKCCSSPSDTNTNCQCLMKKPREAPARADRGYFLLDELQKEDGRFFCMHRTTDDGFHRECAGWAAKMHKKP